MKKLFEKKIPLLIFAGALIIFLFQGRTPPPAPEIANEAEKPAGPAFSEPPAGEDVIYLCRLGNEETPAVQIWEVRDRSGRVTGTVGRLDDSKTEVTADSAPVWDYKSVAARSAGSRIEIAYDPNDKYKDYDWILTLADQETAVHRRVRDCLEVADE